LPFGAEAPERGAVQAASGAQARAVLHNHTLYAGKQAGFETAVPVVERLVALTFVRRAACCQSHIPAHIWPFEQILVLIFRQDSLCVGLRRAAGELLVAAGEVLLRSAAAA